MSGPSHGTLTLNADGSFSYTPAADFHGTDTFTYQATDGTELSTVATVSIQVTPVNDAPAAADDTFGTSEETVLTVAAPGVLANDLDAEGEVLTATLVGGPSHGSLTFDGDGSFIYTPASNFNGADSFTYRASDASADSDIVTVTITVNPVNDAPVASADGFSTIEDIPLVVDGAWSDRKRYRPGRRPSDRGPRQGAKTRHAGVEYRRQLRLHAGGQLQRRRQLHLSGERRHGRLECRDGRDCDHGGDRYTGGGRRQL